nr:DUF6210 family protein [Acanthopleuribacter pedis]
MYNLNGVGVVIKKQTGVIYSNQVGGHSCLQPKIEGVFLPLDTDHLPEDYRDSNLNALENLDWQAQSGNLTVTLADQVDAILARHNFSTGILVDRRKLEDSYEAWVHVTLSPSRDSVYQGPARMEGVLTWPNSD